MPRGKPLSNEEKSRVSAFKEMGLSNRQIPTKLGLQDVSLIILSNWAHNMKKTGNMDGQENCLSALNVSFYVKQKVRVCFLLKSRLI